MQNQEILRFLWTSRTAIPKEEKRAFVVWGKTTLSLLFLLKTKVMAEEWKGVSSVDFIDLPTCLGDWVTGMSFLLSQSEKADCFPTQDHGRAE